MLMPRLVGIIEQAYKSYSAQTRRVASQVAGFFCKRINEKRLFAHPREWARDLMAGIAMPLLAKLGDVHL